MAWLSVWSKVQIICIWSSWRHCHPINSCSSKIQNGLLFWCWLTQVVLTYLDTYHLHTAPGPTIPHGADLSSTVLITLSPYHRYCNTSHINTSTTAGSGPQNRTFEDNLHRFSTAIFHYITVICVVGQHDILCETKWRRFVQSVLWCCWIRSVKTNWSGTGMVMSAARCKWFAYGPADVTATPSSLAPVKSRMVYGTFLVLAYPCCPGKRPWNGCSSSSSKWWRFVALFKQNWIGLRKCPYYHYLTKNVMSQ